MEFQWKKTRFRIDFLMLLFPIIAILLGEGTGILILMLSLSAHELAHLAAARALRVGLSAIRLTPFGGHAQLENPYTLSAARLCAVAAAGPLANLLLILTAASLGQWRILLPHLSADFVRINAMLMLFNLIPALPLDGGRILYSLLSLFLTRIQAMRIGLAVGKAIVAMLILLTLWGLIQRRQLNLSPLFAAVFLLASADDERRAMRDSHLHALLNGLSPISVPTPAALVAMDASTSPAEALQHARPDKVTLYAVYKDGHLAQITDDRTLLGHLLTLSSENSAKKVPKYEKK